MMAGLWASLEASWAMRGSLVGGELHEHEAGSREVGGGSRVLGLVGGELGKLQEGAAQSHQISSGSRAGAENPAPVTKLSRSRA